MIDSTSHPQIEQVLHTLINLLRKYGHDYHATYVANLRSLWPAQPGTFQSQASGGDMWGGSGSVFDVTFVDARRPPGEVQDDIRTFCVALAHLAAAMRRAGIGSQNADGVAAVTASWYPDAGIELPTTTSDYDHDHPAEDRRPNA